MKTPYARTQAFLDFFTRRVEGTAKEIVESIHPNPSVSLDQVEVLGELGCAVGFLEKSGDNLRLVRQTDNARNVVQALMDILGSGRPLLADFEQADPKETWVRVLDALENRRIESVNRDCRRTVVLNHAIIIGEFAGRRYLLVEWDIDRWGTIKPIGGRQTPGETPLAVLVRHLRKNLDSKYHDKLGFHDDDLGDNVQNFAVSKCVGIYTRYVLHAFAAYPKSPLPLSYDGLRSAYLHWMAVAEVRLGLQMFPRCFFVDALPATVIRLCESPEIAAYPMQDSDVMRLLQLEEVTSRTLGGTSPVRQY
ncbi:MAG: hypothetical protein QOI24_1420 [Acidobacteriota bacterium]|jgi:hypothetical protein|nr:hypothetical protein [Acidobacteriota bacterium]